MFYGEINNEDTTTTAPFQVDPWQGMLVPRGVSASGITDNATLAVRLAHDDDASKQMLMTTTDDHNWWLVVGTEEATWHYQ
jgi:hypothetical protein